MKLRGFSDKNDFASAIKQTLDVVETLQSHFEFTYELLRSGKDSNIEDIKAKFCDVSHKYNAVQGKENLTLVPGKDCLITVYRKMYLELKKVLKNCFKEGRQKEIQLNRTQVNLLRIKTLVISFTCWIV